MEDNPMDEEDRGRRSECPINIALEVFGDRWSLLVIRDMMFFGRKTYQGFLNGPEGIATNVLADRLMKLEEAGLIEKTRDPSDGRRFVYRLTPKGADLAPVLVEMILWAAEHERTGAPADMIESIKADRDRYIASIKERLDRA